MQAALIAQAESFRYVSQWPWLVLALIATPLVGLAWRLRVFPTWNWMILLGCSLALSLVAIFVPPLASVVLLVDGLLVALVVIDLAILGTHWRHNLTAERKVARTASLGVELPCELTLHNASPLRLRGAVRDDLPDEFECRPSLHRLNLPPHSRVTLRRRLLPGRRGAFKLEQ